MRRRLLVLLIALTAAACSARQDVAEPFVESRSPPSLGSRYYPPEGWAWGLFQLGEAPMQRYGVSSPPVVPKGQIVILPSLGETAEGWFETARDFSALGYTVWILEAAGQGGSGRLAGPKGVAHATDLHADVEAVRAFLRTVVRPGPEDRVFLLAAGTSAPVGLAAAEGGGAPLAGLILSGPMPLKVGNQSFSLTPTADTAIALGGDWTRPDLATLPPRAAAQAGWQVANPDLRIGGYTWGYVRAWRKLQAEVLPPAAIGQIRAPMLCLNGKGAAGSPCPSARDGRDVAVDAPAPLQFAGDATRLIWLTAIADFIRPPDNEP